MRTFCLFSTACLLAAFLTPIFTAQAIVMQQWDYRFSGPYHGVYPSCGVGVDSSGNSYICGSVWRPMGSGREIYINKFSPTGDTLWTSIYGGMNQDNLASAMVVDAAGNLYMTGTKEVSGTGADYLTQKFNTQGQLQWVATYIGPENDDRGAALAVDNNGNVYVTGRSSDANFNYDFVTIKYDPRGQQMWVARYSSSDVSDDLALDLAVDADRNIYVTGMSSTRDWPNTNYDIVTLKYNSQGQQLWRVGYDGAAHDYDTPATLKLDAQANVYITGLSTISANNTDYITLKYNSAGNRQWAVPFQYQQNAYESATDLVVDTDGSVIVSGFSLGAGMITLKYNAGGGLQWQRRGGSDPGYFDTKVGLALAEDHNIYVVGMEGTSWLNLTCATFKYSSLGDLRWTALYDPDACCEAGFDVALDNQGNVFVTGEFWWPDYGDVHPLLVKYDQTSGDVSAIMIPTVSPVIIPAQGGEFSYNLHTFNAVRNNLATDFWWKLIYPPPSQLTQILPPVMVSLPLDSTTFLRRQRIAGNLPAGIYHYVIYAGDYPDIIWASDTILVIKSNTVTGLVVEEGLSHMPEFGLTPNPNPFNLTTAISFKLRTASHVSLKVYDISGRLVATLVAGWQEPGDHVARFDGAGLASGIYLVKLQAGEFTATQKMILLK